jgi:Ni,Fe-hydrogenase I large subunit
MEDGNAPINTARLAIVDRSIQSARHMMNDYYLPDVLAIGHLYVQKGYVSGGGLAKERVLGFGMFPEEPFSGATNGDFFKDLLVRCNGVVENFAGGVMQAKVYDFKMEDVSDPEVISESVEHGWYEYSGGDSKGLHPWEGETKPHYTEPKEGTKTEWKALNEQGKYSWLKTPKWRGKLCEVGPLARYIVLYTKAKQGLLGDLTWAEQMIVDQIDAVTKVLGVPAEAWLPSTVGRTAARALDAQLQAEISKFFFDKLVANIKSGDTRVVNNDKWDPSTWPKEAKGVGFYEAPRGALSHWVVIKDGKVANYQAVVPTTWNACPRDDAAGHGAYEMSMMDTPVKIADKPLEIVKAVRSFDPCMACSTHLFNAKGEKIRVVTTDPYAGVRVDE